MLSLSLDCLRPVSCVPKVVSVSGLSLSGVLCAQCCHCLWIVFVWCLVCPMLSLSLDCLRLVSCLPKVVSVFGLSSSGVFCAQGCQCLWIVFVWCLVCPMLSLSLDCLRPVSFVPKVVSVSGLSSSGVLCAQFCQCLWMNHSWLPLRFSLTFTLLLIHICIVVGDPIRIRGWDPIILVITDNFVCLYQSRTCISNTIYRDLFVFNNFKWDLVVRFIDNGGIAGYHCLNFILFYWYLWNCWRSLFKLYFVLLILVELLAIIV
jgi:hypothetical protein